MERRLVGEVGCTFVHCAAAAAAALIVEDAHAQGYGCSLSAPMHACWSGWQHKQRGRGASWVAWATLDACATEACVA